MRYLYRQENERQKNKELGSLCLLPGRFSPAITMAAFTGGFAIAFTLGFFYFIGAIPAGIASGLNPWTAAVAAWLGYTASCGLMVGAGAPLRDWVARKLQIPAQRDTKKWIWKAWSCFGLPGLALIGPVTTGPQAGPIISLLAGEKPRRTFLFFSLAALPWAAAFAIASSGIPRIFPKMDMFVDTLFVEISADSPLTFSTGPKDQTGFESVAGAAHESGFIPAPINN